MDFERAAVDSTPQKSMPRPLEPLRAAAPRLGRRHSFTRRQRWVIALAGGLLLFYGAAGYLGSAPLIGENPRWRGMNRGPQDFGLKSEVVSFPSQDGISLKAWWLPAEGIPKGDIVIAHGVDHTRQVMLPRASFLVRGGYNVLAVDLRGHGESAAQYVSPGYLEARDILGAVQYIRTRGEHAPLGVLGVSYGAAAALLAATQSREISAVIADGAYPTGRDAFENINRYFVHNHGTRLWLRALFLINSCPGVPRAISLVYYARTGIYLGPELVSVLPAASQLRIPVLLISGDRDWIVPTEQVRKIFAVLPNERKSLVVIPNAAHDTTYSSAPALYQNRVLTFLDDNLAN
jgi:alpha-beta hydrolase superfamily lysophospholipase